MQHQPFFKRQPLALAVATLLAAGVTSTSAQAATRTWDGDGGSNDWSYISSSPRNTNWTANPICGFSSCSLPLANGDALVFAGTTRLTPNNDLSNRYYAGLSFAANAGAFTLNGNAIISTGNITNNSSNLQTINMPLTVGGNQTWNGGTAGLRVNGFTYANGAGAYTLNGSNITSTGNITNSSTNQQTIDMPLTVGASQTWNGIHVNGFNYADDAAAYTLSGNNITSTGNITNNSANLQTIDMPIVVGSDQTWNGGMAGMQVKGKVTLGDHALTLSNGTTTGNFITNFTVGDSGNASLTLASGSKIGMGIGYLGFNSGSAGTVTVDGANSLWANRYYLSIGISGSGTLNIRNGGKVSNADAFLGSSSSTGIGIATVDGADSLWENSQTLSVGRFGSGTLNILNGGKVSNTSGYLGFYSGSTGTATVDGANSLWENSQALSVGHSGSGTLNIQNGGKVSNTHGILGNDDGVGTATVDGANSLWANNGKLTVGNSGSGTLNIENGGKVSNTDGILGNDDGVGTATVDGANSLWANSQSLNIGVDGHGTLNIENSGSVTVGNHLSIGSQGILNLAGGRLSINAAASSNAGEFNWRSGTLNLTDTDGVTLGNNVFAPAITHLGAGQNLDVTNTLTVNSGNFLLLSDGQVKAGSLALNGGIIAGTALNMTHIGQLIGYGSVASAIIDGTATNTIQASGGTLTLGNANVASGFDFGGHLKVGGHRIILLDQDQAQLGSTTTLADGGQLEAGKGLALGNGETLSYTGNASILGNFSNNGVVSGSGGALTFLNDVNGAGSFAGDIVFHAAFNPGNSPAAVDFNGGNATYDSTSVLTMEIFGNTPGTEYDQLLNIDHLAFDGILNLVFGPAFTPDAGQSFALFDFNSFSGSLAADRITVSGIDRNRLNLSSLANNGRLQIAAVPLPGGVWLFGSGLALLGLARRKNV